MPSLLTVCTVEAAELSFLLFLLPAGLVFDGAVGAFVAFYFYSFEKKVISLLIPKQMWLESRNAKLFESKKSARKSNGSNLIQALISPDSWEVFVNRVCLRSEGFFNRRFLDLSFHSGRTLWGAKTRREFVQLTKNFKGCYFNFFSNKRKTCWDAFLYDQPTFFSPISKLIWNFSSQSRMGKPDTIF